MVVRVHLHFNVQYAPELIDVGLAAGTAKDAFFRKRMELAYISGENFIPAAETCVGSHNGVIRPGNSHCGTAVEFVGREAALVRRLGDAVIDAAAVNAFGVAHGEVLAVEADGDGGPALGVVDREAGLAVAAFDGGGHGEEGRHGCDVFR